MPCKEVKSRTYQTRKSPPFHAKDCKNLTKKGKDGKYVSKSDSRGVYKWIKSGSTRSYKKGSKRVLAMLNDPETVWGKNPKLEHFWTDLASGKNVVLIYKNGEHKYVGLPKRTTAKYQSTLADFDSDKDIVAVLSSNPSQDAYEQYLYPKAKHSSVDSVIKNYRKYFKPILSGAKMRVPL